MRATRPNTVNRTMLLLLLLLLLLPLLLLLLLLGLARPGPAPLLDPCLRAWKIRLRTAIIPIRCYVLHLNEPLPHHRRHGRLPCRIDP
jgi:hypothetical protein